MHSLSRYSRFNQINLEWIEEYLNEAHSKGLTSIRSHCNVMAWSADRERLKRIKNDVGSQLALMEAKPVSYTHLDVYKRQDKELSPCDSSRSKYCELYQ